MENSSNKYALAALKEKRATLAGEIVSLKKQIEWKQEALLHLDASIAIFEPGYDLKRIRPKRVKTTVRLFNQGELGRLILDALRSAGRPMTTIEVVTAVLALTGNDEKARPALRGRVRSCLQYLHKERRTVNRSGEKRETRWALNSLASFASQ
jgi:hypothetical protein